MPQLPLHLLLAVIAHQFDDFLLPALGTDVVVVIRPGEVGQHVIDIAFHNHTSLAVHGHPLAYCETVSAQFLLALHVHHILLFYLPTAHAAVLPQLSLVRGYLVHLYQLELVLTGAGVVALDVRGLAAQAVKPQAGAADLRAFLCLLAEVTLTELVETVYQDEWLPATTSVREVGYQFSGLGGIEFVREVGIAGLADAKIAVGVIVDASVAD
jgi:hypothetical protein